VQGPALFFTGRAYRAATRRAQGRIAAPVNAGTPKQNGPGWAGPSKLV